MCSWWASAARLFQGRFARTTFEDFLIGTEEQFKARQETAEARTKDLTKRFVSLNGTTTLRDLAWAPEEEYKRGVALIEGALKPRSSANEP
jgi:hypothetical protein